MPVVSVLLPVYNAMPYLKDAVASVLGQTFADIEVIALDDASTDGSLEYLRGLADPRLDVVARPKSGLSLNLNYGIGIARAPLIARMDADDISLPTRFERQVARMNAEQELVACGCDLRFIDPAGEIGAGHQYYADDALIRWNLLTDSAFAHPGMMLRKAALERAGLYRREQEPAEDYALWLELAKLGRLANVPEVLLHYRIHPGSVSSRRVDVQRELVREFSLRHLVTGGYAADEGEAAAFRAIARGEASGYSPAVDSYIRVAGRFLAEHPGAAKIARRKLLGLAKRSRGWDRIRCLGKAIFFR